MSWGLSSSPSNPTLLCSLSSTSATFTKAGFRCWFQSSRCSRRRSHHWVQGREPGWWIICLCRRCRPWEGLWAWIWLASWAGRGRSCGFSCRARTSLGVCRSSPCRTQLSDRLSCLRKARTRVRGCLRRWTCASCWRAFCLSGSRLWNRMTRWWTCCGVGLSWSGCRSSMCSLQKISAHWDN